ncbi:GNAT family N-acetyltransferase [Oryzifoliimicrobium ureilyticus]|uniref:GNAT family N-acetyltransferase n=1 Tax=Oryzifoliimicrobium ureilyticus TaxID=3113724 RepID=UPI0030767B7D
MGAFDGDFPELVTSRLVLRAPRLSDHVAMHAILMQPEVTRTSNLPDQPTKAQTQRAVKWMCEVFAKQKGCAWIIEERASGSVIGAIRFNWIAVPSKSGEVGYELTPSAWGKGLMTEAARAVTECGFALFKLNRIEAWTLNGNTASDRVLEKTGFRYEGTLRQKAYFKNAFHDLRMFSLLAADVLSSL